MSRRKRSQQAALEQSGKNPSRADAAGRTDETAAESSSPPVPPLVPRPGLFVVSLLMLAGWLAFLAYLALSA